MAIAIGILLVAVGGVLVWGADRTASGLAGTTIGVILIALGAVGAVASIVLSARTTATSRPNDGWGPDSLIWVHADATRDDETPLGRR